MVATFVESKHEGSNIWTFYFATSMNLDYIAGQFIELSIALPAGSKDKNKRWFTLSSSPTEPRISITTRIYKTSRSDFKTSLKNLKSGDAVNISQAMGDFVLPKDRNAKLVFIASGIGITPYHSIIKSLLSKLETTRSITLIHYIKTSPDQVFSDLFESFPCSYIVTKTKLSAETINNLVPEITKSTVYISGPEQFVENLRNGLLNEGMLSEHQVIGDYFPGYPLG